MSKVIAAVALAVAIFGWATDSQAANASREKCTCDAKPGTIQDNGAWVDNATACWSTVDEQREWCKITVQAIEGDERQKAIINELIRTKDDPADLIAFLQTQAQSSIKSNGDQSSDEFAKARSELPAVMKSFDALTAACIDGFLHHAKDHRPFKDIDEGAFACHIGEATGWLRMSYRIGEIQFVFMIAPDA